MIFQNSFVVQARGVKKWQRTWIQNKATSNPIQPSYARESFRIGILDRALVSCIAIYFVISFILRNYRKISNLLRHFYIDNNFLTQNKTVCPYDISNNDNNWFIIIFSEYFSVSISIWKCRNIHDNMEYVRRLLMLNCSCIINQSSKRQFKNNSNQK